MRIRVGGIVIKDNKLLLMHRFKNGREYYVVPGGGVQRGKGLIEALLREIREETGLRIEVGKEVLKINKPDHIIF